MHELTNLTTMVSDSLFQDFFGYTKFYKTSYFSFLEAPLVQSLLPLKSRSVTHYMGLHLAELCIVIISSSADCYKEVVKDWIVSRMYV